MSFESNLPHAKLGCVASSLAKPYNNVAERLIALSCNLRRIVTIYFFMNFFSLVAPIRRNLIPLDLIPALCVLVICKSVKKNGEGTSRLRRRISVLVTGYYFPLWLFEPLLPTMYRTFRWLFCIHPILDFTSSCGYLCPI